MEKAAFEGWLESVSASFLTLSDQQRNQSLDQLISLSNAVQLRHLSNGLEALLKRDFLRLLPLELTFYLLRCLDPQTLLTCCLVCKQWNKVISACTEVWQGVCRDLGWRIDDSIQDASHWKGVYLKAKLRMMQLKNQEAFETSSLIGHSARVYALYYKDGLLCTGSDDLSAKLWDVRTGQCIYGIQTHTCATVKFDEQKLVTGSFDNTIACWEWSTGAKIQQFRGHTGAVFSVDYNDDLDTLVSGSADFSVKVWALSAGACLNTLTGHTEWVTKVILQKSEVESMVHCPGDYILLSSDKYEIKVWPIGREINCKCLKTLSVSEDRSVCLQPRLQFDGRYIVCSSDLGVYQWDFASFDILRGGLSKTAQVKAGEKGAAAAQKEQQQAGSGPRSRPPPQLHPLLKQPLAPASPPLVASGLHRHGYQLTPLPLETKREQAILLPTPLAPCQKQRMFTQPARASTFTVHLGRLIPPLRGG
ncbi:F-box/WD repeat-containing protein 2 isoform X1 [Coregonus clupeaformis]|uniref:F-box/WD repeat-containing protein 2 isoform X1 n=1 Tax=Coregonus clupeaformis TaxID=59861 RepID=UPI001E1C2D95|nr:F-box/WD repeat-containing protein 2 isoform X1 [Coregonus clupeaformis]XP_045071139.1 F-box/WD repeat-containing protein 2 isoform X1 [Coregonus clupeaformis]XP_045071140.1 F-box/WD repeat-containing protein 2 isoform X1 [Coregonus clupeaformis]XP_045071141.1 F-box/WD repeat-containing protein 2 isoform X1 [Coregonus clupeaformis]